MLTNKVRGSLVAKNTCIKHPQINSKSKKMGKENLKELSVEQLKKKEKGLKTIIGIFIPIIIGLFFFIIRDYLDGEDFDWSILTVGICTLGGPASLYPELKEVQKELSNSQD